MSAVGPTPDDVDETTVTPDIIELFRVMRQQDEAEAKRRIQHRLSHFDVLTSNPPFDQVDLASDRVTAITERGTSEATPEVHPARLADESPMEPVMLGSTVGCDPASRVSTDWTDSSPLFPSTSNYLVNCVREEFDDLAREAERFATHRIYDCLGRIAERFGASTAGLFRLRDGARLCADFQYNCRSPNFEISINARPSIVAHVARENRGYCGAEVKNQQGEIVDEYYCDSLPETRSNIAVPIVDHTERDPNRRLVGVLNLESRRPYQFTVADVGPLTLAASEFLSFLLILDGASRHTDRRWLPWNPDAHGWDLISIFPRLADRFADAVSRDTCAATIWYADWPKECLFVYATSGYDYEYQCEQVLPLNSSTGRHLSMPPGVYEADPKDFVRKDKAALMGLERTFHCPIYLPGDSEARAIAVLNVYLRQTKVDEAELRNAMRYFAAAIGAIAASFDRQRQRVAECRLRHLLAEMPWQSGSEFETILEFMRSVFDADGGTFWVQVDDTLRCAATTGLYDGRRFRGDAQSRHPVFLHACLDLKKDVGYTTSHAKHPGEVVRINNMLDLDEPGRPAFLPQNGPQLKFSESFFPRTHDKRRMLAVAIPRSEFSVASDVDGLGDESGIALGVVRLLRRGGTKPYTRCDERLMLRLARVCQQVVSDARSAWLTELRERRASRRVADCVLLGPLLKASRHRSLVGPTSGRRRIARDAVEALLRLQAPLIGSSDALVSELLKDLYLSYQAYKVGKVELFVRRGTTSTSEYSLYAQHSRRGAALFRDRPPDTLLNANEFRSWYDERAKQVHDGAQPVSIAMTLRRDPEKGRETPSWSLVMPVLAWPGDEVEKVPTVEGVIALKSRDPSTFAGLPTEPLLLAAARLAAIWYARPAARLSNGGLVERSGAELHRVSLGSLIERFREYAAQHEPRASVNWGTPSGAEWRLDEAPAGYGIRRRREGALFAIPLYFGPMPCAHVQLRGVADGAGRQLPGAMIADLSRVWSRWTLGRIDMVTATCVLQDREHVFWTGALSASVFDAGP